MNSLTRVGRTIARVFLIVVLLTPGVGGLSVQAQVVSAGITGTVIDADEKPVPGVVVVARHLPTNTTVEAISAISGRFSLRGLPVGGPYQVSGQSDGYVVQPLTGVETSLGEDTEVTLSAREDIVVLERFEVMSSTTDLDASATGASTVVSNRRINTQPTVSRSFADMMKTNPFVSIRFNQQIQALGMNSRYNSIMLDGAKINDSFGLNSSGLFSLANPFSLEAVEQISISLTPYDVRQSGFGGAAMNVVSKSGTNEIHGSVYGLFTESKWQGKDLSGTTDGTRPALKERTYGFTFGGPIKKDRLFFFFNWEKFIRDAASASPAFFPDPTFMTALQTRIDALPGSPDLGVLGGASTVRLSDSKRLFKLDWNINTDHRLSLRYSETIGSLPATTAGQSFSQPATIPGQPSSFPNGVVALSSNFFNIPSSEKVWAAQLFSHWTPDLKTEFRYSSTQQDSVRETAVTFPEIRIFNIPSDEGSTGNAIRFGSEVNSMGNGVKVETDTFSGSADYIWQSLTLTAGADHEASDYLNLFRPSSYGVFDYASLTAFQNDTPFGFLRSVADSDLPAGDVSQYRQTGVFGQIKWEPSSRFNATLGLRFDYLGSPIAPEENPAFVSAFGMTNTGTIDGTHIFQPRFSFNYALDRERATQVRGGVGVFRGRNPWVWISNSFGNTGVGRFNLLQTSQVPTLTQYLTGTYPFSSDPAFAFDPDAPYGMTNLAGGATSINLIRPGMKLPTIRRANLAIDRKVPALDAVVTLEYIHTEHLSALFVDNINLNPSAVGADGRQRFSGVKVSGFSSVVRLRDVNAGESHYVSLSLDRPFKNDWAYTVGYTRGRATEAQALSSSTANSLLQSNAVFNQNQIEVARSEYETRDRVQASISRRFHFRDNLATTVSLYYEGRSGLPFSYVYTSDLNGDTLSNDLVAVPTGLDDPRFDFVGGPSPLTAAQQDAYFAFMESSGLSKYAGGYAPRNAFLTPWQNRLDLRVKQELPAYRNLKMEIFVDFINFGSWVNEDFFNYTELISASNSVNVLGTLGSQGRFIGTGTYSSPAAGATIRPGPIALGANSTLVPNNNESRWKVQTGLKLTF